ncbi:MAG: diguanylate cyclase [Thauera sp.]|nr:diguanylate cyclase [Thauera sp.]
MRWGRDLSLFQRLLLLVLIPVSLLTAMISGAYLSRGTRLAEEAVRERGIAIVSFLAPAAEYGVISGNAANLQGLLAAAMAQQDVRVAAIYDRSRSPIILSGTPALADFERVVAAGGPRLVEFGAGRFSFAAPVLSQPVAVDDVNLVARPGTAMAEADVVGWVYVELDTASYLQRRRAIVVFVGALAIVTLVLTALFAIRLARSVGEPVDRLADAVRRMAAGDLEVRVPLGGGSPELRELQQGFNVMARSIADAHYNLQVQIKEATGHLAYQAMHDPLTGLPNRRAFELALEDAVQASRRAADHGALCFIDLDRFKRVNDLCGHAAGDALLQQIGDVIRHTVRAQDMICRVGGDEFALILRGCAPADARRIADALCRAIEAHAFDWEGEIFHVGASVGMARIDDHTRSPSDVLKAADLACYEAKRGGRGQVVEHRAAPGAGGRPD